MVRFIRAKKIQAANWIIDRYQPSILILDDEAANFSEAAINAAKKAGYRKIERIYFVNSKNISRVTEAGRFDIVILDIKGVVDRSIASDGLQLAELIRRRTSAYIAITSAHQYHLDKRILKVDRILEDRVLTTVDFINLLDEISQDMSLANRRLAKRLALRFALTVVKNNSGQIVG